MTPFYTIAYSTFSLNLYSSYVLFYSAAYYSPNHTLRVNRAWNHTFLAVTWNNSNIFLLHHTHLNSPLIYPSIPTKIVLWHRVGHQSEKAITPHSSTLAWKIPWTEEPGGLQSMGSLGVGHDWGTSVSLFTFMRWRRKWQPTPVFLPGESQGWGSLVGCRPWGRTESDTTEVT